MAIITTDGGPLFRDWEEKEEQRRKSTRRRSRRRKRKRPTETESRSRAASASKSRPACGRPGSMRYSNLLPYPTLPPLALLSCLCADSWLSLSLRLAPRAMVVQDVRRSKKKKKTLLFCV